MSSPLPSPLDKMLLPLAVLALLSPPSFYLPH